MMPFSREQFFGVFAEYNAAVWPAQVVLYLLVPGDSTRVDGHRRQRVPNSAATAAVAIIASAPQKVTRAIDRTGGQLKA